MCHNLFTFRKLALEIKVCLQPSMDFHWTDFLYISRPLPAQRGHHRHHSSILKIFQSKIELLLFPHYHRLSYLTSGSKHRISTLKPCCCIFLSKKRSVNFKSIVTVSSCIIKFSQAIINHSEFKCTICISFMIFSIEL